jgi:hypothetical protein
MKNRKGLLCLWAEPTMASGPAWLNGPAKFGLKSQAEAGDFDPPVASALAQSNPAGRRCGSVGKRSASLTKLGGTDLGKFQAEKKQRREGRQVVAGGDLGAIVVCSCLAEVLAAARGWRWPVTRGRRRGSRGTGEMADDVGCFRPHGSAAST